MTNLKTSQLAERTSLASTDEVMTLSGGLNYRTPVSSLQGYWQRTAEEISASVTPSDLTYEPGNIKRYGATGDGVADDTQAIKDAVASANAGQGIVLIPQGTYSCTSMAFSNLSNVHFQGIGLPTLRSDGPGSVEPDRNLFNFTTACTDISFDSIDFDGNYDAHLVGLPANTTNHLITIGFDDRPLDQITCERWRITNCKFRRSGWQKAGADKFGDNLRVVACDDLWVERCIFEDPGRWQISTASGARHTIKNNIFLIDTATRDYALGTFDWEYTALTSAQEGYVFESNVIRGLPRFSMSGDQGIQNIRIIGNYIDAVDLAGNSAGATSQNRGIGALGCSGVIIANNSILNCELSGSIIIDPNGNNISNWVISGNHIDGVVDGILLSTGNATEIIITGNRVRASGSAQVGMDFLKSTFSKLVITGNIIESAQSFPARIQTTETLCNSNKFISGVGTRVQFYCATDNVFQSNACADDIQLISVSGATGCFIGPNQGAWYASGDAIEDLEGTTALFPTSDDRSPLEHIGILALDNTGTPDVSKAQTFITGGTTTITDFDGGSAGRAITILSEHAVTITDGTNILLNGSANFVMASQDSLSLIQKANGNWYETSRMVN